MASVASPTLPKGEDEGKKQSDEKDLTKLGKRAQTDYTKFDNVEDTRKRKCTRHCFEIKSEGNSKFKTTDFKGAIDSYSEALNTLANESSSAKDKYTEQQKVRQTKP